MCAITVSFFIGQGVDFGGRAIISGMGGAITRSQVQINLPPEKGGNPMDLYVESVILHELGHALGLGHAQIGQDAMNPAIDTSPHNYGLPSTLDLYALHQLSQAANLGESICLPSDIGYGIPPWVEERPDATVLSIPSSEYRTALELSVSYLAPVFPGESVTFTNPLSTASRELPVLRCSFGI